MYKGVIFDLDGTLVESWQDIAAAMNHILQAKNFPVHQAENYKYFIGNGLKNLVSVTLPESERNEKVITECLIQLKEYYNDHCLVETKLYDGIAELLDQLEERAIKLAIFSNKAHELTVKIAKALLQQWNFEMIIGMTTEELKKPNPQVPYKISQSFKIPAEQILYLGDSGVDMQTANNAGMYAAGALWGFRDANELISNGAKLLVQKPLELLHHFN